VAGNAPIWHVSSSSGVATSVSKLLYPCYLLLLYFDDDVLVSWQLALSSNILLNYSIKFVIEYSSILVKPEVEI